MKRPVEYENLISRKALEEVKPTPGAIDGFIKNAQGYLETAKSIDPKNSLPVFTLAYEGYFQIVQAVFEFYSVRCKDSGRNLAIQRVSADLGVGPSELPFIIRAHARRNNSSYVSPFPPLSKQEAQQMLALLEKYLPQAIKLTSSQHLHDGGGDGSGGGASGGPRSSGGPKIG